MLKKLPKYTIVYLDIKPDYAKLNNLPVKLPVLLEDFENARNNNKISLGIIIRGLSAQYDIDNKDDYYKSYLVFYMYENFKRMLEEGKNDEAGEYLKKIKDIHYDYRYHFYSGLLNEKKGNDEFAEIEFKETLNKNPDFYTGYYELGNLFFKRKIYDEALEYYQKAIDIDSKFILPYLKTGDLYLENARYDEALEYYRKALETDKNFIPAYIRIGVIYNQTQRYTDSVIIHEKALGISKENSEIFYNYSYALSRNSRLYDAVKALEKASEIDEKDYFLHELAVLYKNTGEYYRAYETEIKAYEKSSMENKNLIAITLLKIAVFLENENEIEKYYKILSETEYSVSAESLVMLYYIGSGNIEKAKEKLSLLNEKGLFMNLPERLENIDYYIEKIENKVSPEYSEIIMNSFTDDGFIDRSKLYLNFKEKGIKYEYTGWINEKGNNMKIKPSGVDFITEVIKLSGFNYALGERIVTEMSQIIWKDGIGIAFSKIFLRFFQDRIFGEMSPLNLFMEENYQEISDISFRLSGMMVNYEDYIMDFDDLLEYKIKTFEDVFSVFVSANYHDYKSEYILKNDFADEITKKMMLFVSDVNYL